MAATDIAIAITGTDSASPTIQRVNAVLEEQARSFQRAGAGSQQLERQWQKLTSGTEFLASGIMHVRRALEAMVWTTIITATAAFTMKIIEAILHTKDFEAETKQLASSLLGLIGQLDPARQKTEAFTAALYQQNTAQLALQQTQARMRIAEIERELVRLDQTAEQGLTGWQQALVSLEHPSAHGAELTRLLALAQQEAIDKANLLHRELTLLQLAVAAQPPTWKEFTDQITAASDAQKKITSANQALLTQNDQLALQLTKLTKGEEAYWTQLRQMLIMQGADSVIVDQNIAKQRELQEAQRRQASEAARSKEVWKQSIDILNQGGFAYLLLFEKLREGLPLQQAILEVQQQINQARAEGEGILLGFSDAERQHLAQQQAMDQATAGLQGTSPFAAQLAAEQQAQQLLLQGWQNYYTQKQIMEATSGKEAALMAINNAQMIVGSLSMLASAVGGHSKAMFAIQKGLAIAQAAINTAEAVTKAMTLPFPLNIAIAGLMAAMGAAQIAAIAASNPGAPVLAGVGGASGTSTGGVSGGSALLAGGGTPSGGSLTVNVTLQVGIMDNKTVLDQIAPAVANAIGEVLNDNGGRLGQIIFTPNTGYRRM